MRRPKEFIRRYHFIPGDEVKIVKFRDRYVKLHGDIVNTAQLKVLFLFGRDRYNPYRRVMVGYGSGGEGERILVRQAHIRHCFPQTWRNPAFNAWQEEQLQNVAKGVRAA